MMRHKYYGTADVYVEEVQRLLDGAEEAVTQISMRITNCLTHCWVIAQRPLCCPIRDSSLFMR